MAKPVIVFRFGKLPQNKDDAEAIGKHLRTEELSNDFHVVILFDDTNEPVKIDILTTENNKLS